MIRYTTFSAPKAEILDLIFNYAFIEDKLCLFDRDTAYICNYAFIDSKFYIFDFFDGFDRNQESGYKYAIAPDIDDNDKEILCFFDVDKEIIWEKAAPALLSPFTDIVRMLGGLGDINTIKEVVKTNGKSVSVEEVIKELEAALQTPTDAED